MSVWMPDGRRSAHPVGCCRPGNTVVCPWACRRADNEPMMGRAGPSVTVNTEGCAADHSTL